MENGLIKLNSYLSSIFINKKARWEEFFTWYRKCIENTDPNVAKKIGAFSHPIKERKEYSIMLTVKDYAWWKSTFETNPWLTLKPLKTIHIELRTKMIDILDKYNDELSLKENKEAMISLLDYIDDKK